MGILSKLIGDYPTVVFKEITTKKQLQHLYDHGGIALDDYTPYFINYPNDLAEILYHVMADRDSDTCVVYLIKGRTMNNICRLTGVNAYQNEHPIICFSDYDRDMEIKSILYGQTERPLPWRWIDDIIDGNARSEYFHPFWSEPESVIFEMGSCDICDDGELFIVINGQRYPMRKEVSWIIEFRADSLLDMSKKRKLRYHYEFYKNGKLVTNETVHHILEIRNSTNREDGLIERQDHLEDEWDVGEESMTPSEISELRKIVNEEVTAKETNNLQDGVSSSNPEIVENNPSVNTTDTKNCVSNDTEAPKSLIPIEGVQQNDKASQTFEDQSKGAKSKCALADRVKEDKAKQITLEEFRKKIKAQNSLYSFGYYSFFTKSKINDEISRLKTELEKAKSDHMFDDESLLVDEGDTSLIEKDPVCIEKKISILSELNQLKNKADSMVNGNDSKYRKMLEYGLDEYSTKYFIAVIIPIILNVAGIIMGVCYTEEMGGIFFLVMMAAGVSIGLSVYWISTISDDKTKQIEKNLNKLKSQLLNDLRRETIITDESYLKDAIKTKFEFYKNSISK